METSVATPSASGRYVASPIHTISLLLILGVWAFLAWFMAGRVRAAPNPHRVRMYLLTIVSEWLVFAYVVGRAAHGCIHLTRPGQSLELRPAVSAGYWNRCGVLGNFGWNPCALRPALAHRLLLPHRAIHAPAWRSRNDTVGSPFRQCRYLRGDDFPRLSAAPIHPIHPECPCRHRPCRRGVRRGSRISRLAADHPDRNLRTNVRGSGILARQYPPGNDRARLAGFPQRDSWQPPEALESPQM